LARISFFSSSRSDAATSKSWASIADSLRSFELRFFRRRRDLLHEDVRRARRAADAKELQRHLSHGVVRAERRLDGAIELDAIADVTHLTVAAVAEVGERRNLIVRGTTARTHERPAQIDDARGDGVEEHAKRLALIEPELHGELERPDSHEIGVRTVTKELDDLGDHLLVEIALAELSLRVHEAVLVGGRGRLEERARRVVSEVGIDLIGETRHSLHHAARLEIDDRPEEPVPRLELETHRGVGSSGVGRLERDSERVRLEDAAPHLAIDAERLVERPLERRFFVGHREARCARLGDETRAALHALLDRPVHRRLAEQQTVGAIGVRDQRPHVGGRRGHADARGDEDRRHVDRENTT